MPKKPAKKNDAPIGERQRRIYDFLAGNRAGVLATVDPDGNPHGAVIYFTVDKQFNLAFLTRTGTKKYDNLVRNNHVVLVVYDPSKQTVAQVIGKAAEIKNSYAINDVAEEVFKASLHDGGMPPLVKLDLGEYTAFTITPSQIRMAVFADPDSGGYENVFESIESFHLKD